MVVRTQRRFGDDAVEDALWNLADLKVEEDQVRGDVAAGFACLLQQGAAGRIGGGGRVVELGVRLGPVFGGQQGLVVQQRLQQVGGRQIVDGDGALVLRLEVDGLLP